MAEKSAQIVGISARAGRVGREKGNYGGKESETWVDGRREEGGGEV